MKKTTKSASRIKSASRKAGARPAKLAPRRPAAGRQKSASHLTKARRDEIAPRTAKARPARTATHATTARRNGRAAHSLPARQEKTAARNLAARRKNEATRTRPARPQGPGGEEVRILRAMVKGSYDLQQVRMQTGLRLCANFRAKLGLILPVGEEADEDDEKAAKKIISKLKESYQRLTDAIVDNPSLGKDAGFEGDELIGTYSEFLLMKQYEAMESAETSMFKSLEPVLERLPIWNEWLSQQTGIGPAMGGVICSYFDPHKARHVSSFWKYSGLDVGGDGRGRSRRQEHLVEREYVDKRGQTKTRMSITYEPFLKTKLMGVLAGSFLRVGSSWRQVYDEYKHRLETDDRREKVTVAKWKKLHASGEETSHLWTPGRIDFASKRYMIKMFLAELWVRWRELEGLPVTEPYSVAKQGRRPHRAA